MESVFLSLKQSLTGQVDPTSQQPEIPTPKAQETLSKFHQIVQQYVNGEDVIHPENSIQSILGSYSLAAYLEHTALVGRDQIVTNLLSQCSASLQEILQ